MDEHTKSDLFGASVVLTTKRPREESPGLLAGSVFVAVEQRTRMR